MDQMQVISRDTIPPITDVQHDGEVHALGELRDFRWNDQLRDFMPATSEFSVSWVRLMDREVLQPHVHPIQSMMIFYSGSGEMLGDFKKPVAAGDVVVVPAGRQHGFVGGPNGLYALSIQFGEGLYTVPETPRVQFTTGDETLEGLLAYNARRLEGFLQRPIFGLLASGALEDPVQRKAYLESLQIWVDGNQALLFSRQATCMDPFYKATFLRHMVDEMGHDTLHKERAGGPPAEDPHARDAVMEAITNWFTHQMYVLDNAEKTAIVHLVIENASAAYHARAMPALAKYMNRDYFAVHVEADEGHAAMGEALLGSESPRTYARLKAIVGEAWDMIGAMTDRVTELTLASRVGVTT
jgi:mannose-6-phosphate isomerase-like protein (cupin superfamily)